MLQMEHLRSLLCPPFSPLTYELEKSISPKVVWPVNFTPGHTENVKVAENTTLSNKYNYDYALSWCHFP